MPRYVVGTMRRLITLVVLAGAAAGVLVASAPGAAVRPAQLAKAGWTCFLPPQFNPNVHCAPPGQLEAIESGQARAGMFMAFATDDVNSDDAGLLGSGRRVRG